MLVGNKLIALAEFYHREGRLTRAVPLYERAQRLWEDRLGPQHPAVGTLAVNLASCYTRLGALATAEPLYLQALSIFEQDVDFEDAEAVALLQEFVGQLSKLGRSAEASRLRERVARVAALVPAHVEV